MAARFRRQDSGGNSLKLPRLRSLRGNDLAKGICGVRAGQLDLHPSLNPAGDMAKAYPLGASPLRERPLFAYFYLLERVPAPFSLGLRKRRNSRANEDPSPREALLLRSCQALVSIGGRYDTGHR